MGDMRSRALVTRIQTMRASTMMAVGVLVVLMVLFYIKDSKYRERVSKEAQARHRKLEVDSVATHKDIKPLDKNLKVQETAVSKNKADQSATTSKIVTTTTGSLSTTPENDSENEKDEKLEILKYREQTKEKGVPKDTGGRDANDDKEVTTISATPSTTQATTTLGNNDDVNDDDVNAAKDKKSKPKKDNKSKLMKVKDNEGEIVESKPVLSNLEDKSKKENSKQGDEDVNNNKGLIDILGAETKKLRLKEEEINRQIPGNSERSMAGETPKSSSLLKMKLPEQLVDASKMKNEKMDNTGNQIAQPIPNENSNSETKGEVKNFVQAEIRNSLKSPEEENVKNVENKEQKSATPKADNDDMAAQIKMLALKYSITLNETDLPRQSESYTKRLRNKLIQTGRFDLLEGRNCKKRLPKCIIIGVMKAGTEAFSTFLGVHPQVAMQFGYAAMVFFSSSQYENGLEWYRERMTCSTKDQITMEKSPQYFSSPMAPKRIHSMDPKIKLILLVRDPISRALSHFLQQKSSNPDRLRAKTFEECVYNKKTKTVISSSPYIQQSTYSVILKRWLEYFSFKQILIIDGDIFRQNPIRSLHKAENFLDIDNSISKDRLYFNKDKGFYCLKINSTAQQDLEMSCLGSEKGRTHPSIDPEVKSALLKYFRPYNKEFMKMSGLDMEWN